MVLIQVLAAIVVLASGPINGDPAEPDAAPVLVPTSAASGSPAAQAPAADAKKEKKPKKKKSDKVAPDETVDPDQVTDTGTGRGLHFTWAQHPSVRFGNIFRLDLQAKFQEDARGSYPDAQGLDCPDVALPTTCMWELHRDRIGIEGNFTKKIQFEAERELNEQELSDKDVLLGYTPKSEWKDVDLNFSYVKNAQVQVGRFKIPFGLDALTGDSHNDYAFRSLGASYLAPSRDKGVMVHGKFWKKSLNYWTGVFYHDGDNARSKKIRGGNETYAVRVTGLPFRKLSPTALGAFEVGTAFTLSALSNDSNNPNGLRGRTALTQDTFYEAVYVQGHRRRWEADVDWTIGPASLRSELTWVNDSRQQQGLGGADLPDARARAWYVSGTWILTGEPKTRPVKAANEFLRGGFGAVEVTSRFERLWFDSAGGTDIPSNSPRAETIAPSGEKALTLGVNWTLNRWFKIQFNAVRERIEDPARNPIADGGPIWSRIVRFQVVL